VFRDELEVGLEVSDEGEPPAGQVPETGVPATDVTAMLERARNLGGRMEVITRSDGTTLRAVLPLIPPESELASVTN
jgi:signal transduction histidine kinase